MFYIYNNSIKAEKEKNRLICKVLILYMKGSNITEIKLTIYTVNQNQPQQQKSTIAGKPKKEDKVKASEDTTDSKQNKQVHYAFTLI